MELHIDRNNKVLSKAGHGDLEFSILDISDLLDDYNFTDSAGKYIFCKRTNK